MQIRSQCGVVDLVVVEVGGLPIVLHDQTAGRRCRAGGAECQWYLSSMSGLERLGTFLLARHAEPVYNCAMSASRSNVLCQCQCQNVNLYSAFTYKNL